MPEQSPLETAEGDPFGPHNLPYGVFSTADEPDRRRVGVRIGDHVSLSLQGIVGEFAVLGLPARRGPAAEALTHYEETPASAARRVVLKEQQRLANLSRPRSDTRPDKRERRQLMKLHRDQT